MFEPRNVFALPEAPALPEAQSTPEAPGTPEPQSTDRFVATWARTDFRPWVNGSDAIDDAASGEPTTIINATEQLRAEAFADGLAQGEAIAHDAATAAIIDAASRIAAAAARFEPVCDTVIAALLAETVTTLLAEMFGADVADPDHLQRRATQLAQMIRDDIDPIAVRLHPDDAATLANATLANARLPWPIVADKTLERGEIRLETKEGGITDNPAERIERLRCRIAGEVMP